MSAMGVFRHPHLIRGVVHTARGSFVITRGLMYVPNAIGELYAWQRVEPEEHGGMTGTASQLIQHDARPHEM